MSTAVIEVSARASLSEDRSLTGHRWLADCRSALKLSYECRRWCLWIYDYLSWLGSALEPFPQRRGHCRVIGRRSARHQWLPDLVYSRWIYVYCRDWGQRSSFTPRGQIRDGSSMTGGLIDLEFSRWRRDLEDQYYEYRQWCQLNLWLPARTGHCRVFGRLSARTLREYGSSVTCGHEL